MYIEHITCNSCGYPAPCTSPSCNTKERDTHSVLAKDHHGLMFYKLEVECYKGVLTVLECISCCKYQREGAALATSPRRPDTVCLLALTSPRRSTRHTLNTQWRSGNTVTRLTRLTSCLLTLSDTVLTVGGQPNTNAVYL